MTREQIFDAWAPRNAVWSPWAKPVLFSQLQRVETPEPVSADDGMEIDWATPRNTVSAIVVDLAGAMSVRYGLSLASIGYRPVPLFNASPGPLGAAALVDVRPILQRLVNGATLLSVQSLALDAPPAFLLDANRDSALMPRTPGAFDNRSISLPTDFPSGQLLRARGIQEAVLITEANRAPQTDLLHSLLRWQQAGIAVLSKALNDSQEPKPITISRPNRFRIFFYNFLATRGLIRGPLGGFGGTLPMPSVG